MPPSVIIFGIGVLIGISLGAVFGSAIVRRAIVLNLRRLAAAPNMRLYNTIARQWSLTPEQIARRAVRDAAIVAAGASEQPEDAQP